MWGGTSNTTSPPPLFGRETSTFTQKASCKFKNKLGSSLCLLKSTTILKQPAAVLRMRGTDPSSRRVCSRRLQGACP